MQDTRGRNPSVEERIESLPTHIAALTAMDQNCPPQSAKPMPKDLQLRHVARNGVITVVTQSDPLQPLTDCRFRLVPTTDTSGTQSGVQTCVPEIVLASATTPWSVTTRVRFRDNGTGSTCVSFSIENSTSAWGGANSTSNGQYLVPATGKTFRVVVNKYQAWIFQPAASGNRSFVADSSAKFAGRFGFGQLTK